MKEYIKPIIGVVELRTEEAFGFGSAGQVVPNGPDEVSTLQALGLDTSIFVK